LQIFTTGAAKRQYGGSETQVGTTISQGDPSVIATLAAFDVATNVALAPVDGGHSHVDDVFWSNLDPAYVSRPAHCSKCGSPLGWFYSHKGAKKTQQPPVLQQTVAKTGSVAKPVAKLPIPYIAQEEEERLGVLTGICVEFPTGWWTYKVCYKQSVAQYHKDQATGTIDPLWSLGTYDS
jgi:hypothetical protein